MASAKTVGSIIVVVVLIVAGVSWVVLTSSEGGGGGQVENEWKHGKSLHFLIPTEESTWWIAHEEVIKRQAKKMGYTYSSSCCGFSDAKQNNQLETYARTNDVLMLLPCSTKGQTNTVKKVEEEYHTPVACTNNVLGGYKPRAQITYSDFEGGKAMVRAAVKDLKERFGTTEGKTLVMFSGLYKMRAWRKRTMGVKAEMKRHPEMNFVELKTGGTVKGWTEAAETYLSTHTPDAILSASDGTYLRGVLATLEKEGKLYYVGNPNHIFITAIDGYPSMMHWIREGWVDSDFPQAPLAEDTAILKIADKYCFKPDVQYPPYPIHDIPTPLAVECPEGFYWGSGHPTITIKDRGLKNGGPRARTPVYKVTKEIVNKENMWGNKLTYWIGKTDVQKTTFEAKGTRPEWCQSLVDEYENMYERNYAKYH